MSAVCRVQFCSMAAARPHTGHEQLQAAGKNSSCSRNGGGIRTAVSRAGEMGLLSLFKFQLIKWRGRGDMKNGKKNVF